MDYQALNHLLPPVTKGHSKAKKSFDLVHIALSADSQRKSAFVTLMGKFEFQKVPFGLAQRPAYFQWLFNEVLSNLDFAFGYLKHIEIICQHLLKTRLKLKEIKCKFLKRHIQYLGHLIFETGIESFPERLSSLQDVPPPRNLKEVKQVLDLTSYYRKFLSGFADILQPLMALTKKNVPYEWT